MTDLVTPIVNAKKAKIKRQPTHTNRASGLGHYVPELGGCTRRGVYERTSWQEKELHDVSLQFVFDEGNNQEKVVLADLASAGVVVIEQQSSFAWEKYQITGHLDGIVIEGEDAVPIEIKTMSPNVFARINSFEDFKLYPWTRSYMCQIMLYMLSKNIDRAYFLLKNKSTGALKQINVGLDYDLGEFCVRTAEAINKHVANGTLPERVEDREICKDCPFKVKCLPDIHFDKPLLVSDDPAMEKRIKSFLSKKEVAAEADKEWEIITDRMKATCANEKNDNLTVIIGQYTVTCKKDAKGSYRTKVVELE